MKNFRPEAAASRLDAPAPLREGRFDMRFRRQGPQTAVCGRFVCYPFHATRPFRLDPSIPSLLTVYQQSSSGGLYRSDRLTSSLELGRDTAVHVTNQAATIVHDCKGQPASQETRVALDERAVLALTPEPVVLFPGAWLESSFEARLAPGSLLLFTEAFSTFDPEGRSRPFSRYVNDVTIRDAAGMLLLRDRLAVAGETLSKGRLPLGPWRLVLNALLLGPADLLPQRSEIDPLLSGEGLAGGSSDLPGGLGLAVRCVAAGTHEIRMLTAALFSAAVYSAFGCEPRPRPK